MSGSNGNGNALKGLSSDERILQAIAELKEAVGLLWRRVDQAEATATRESQKTQEKIDAWNRTNLKVVESNNKLIEIISLNSQEAKTSISYYEKGSQVLSELSNQLQQCKEAITELQKISNQPNAPSTSPSIQALSNQLAVIQASIDLLSQQVNPTLTKEQLTNIQTSLDQANQTIDSIQASNSTIKSLITKLKTRAGTWSGNFWAVFGLIALLTTMLIGLCSLKWDSNYLVSHINQVIWKLQALEKRLGQ